MKTLLARQCADSMQGDKFPEDALRNVIEDKFLGKNAQLNMFMQLCVNFIMIGKNRIMSAPTKIGIL